MASKYVQPELQAALDERKGRAAQARDLATQLGDARRSYEQALQSYDVQAASTAWAQIQVLEVMAKRAEEAIPQISHANAVRSASVAIGDLSSARNELEAAARGVDADSFADREVRSALATGLGQTPAYAVPAAEKIKAFVGEVRSTLAELNRTLMILNNLKQEHLDSIEAILYQAERLADEARRLAGEAPGVRQEIAKANDTFLRGVTA